MEKNKIPLEHWLYGLAFLVALVLRLAQLGTGPLNNSEASLALQALGLAHAGETVIGSQPGYILLTGALFSLFGATNFLARFIPALAGSLLVWLPFYFRRWMGASLWLHRAGWVLAFGLAIDPGLVSLSRQAGSPMPAMVFTLLALAALYNRRMVWVGIMAGLALLSGPAFLQGLLILGISWVFCRLAGIKLEQKSEPVDGQAPAETPRPAWVSRAIPAFLLTLLVAGTLFLRVPQGLGALADTLSSYLKVWSTASGIPVLRVPAGLLIYQPLALILSVVFLILTWVKEPQEQQVRPAAWGLGIWAGVGIVLPLLYAGRQVGDLSWAIIALWTLAALEIGRPLLGAEDKTERVVAACLAALLVVLAIVGWINLLAIGRYQVNVGLYGAIIVGAFLLGLIAALLVAAGWSVNAARAGMVAALCVVLGLYLFGNMIGISIVRQNDPQDLWSTLPTTGQADLLLTTLSDLSSWNTGLRDQLEVAVVGGPPTLQWVLRAFPNARFESVLSPTEAPPVVITMKGAEEPILAQKYRGQDFVWLLSPAWQGALPPSFVNWLAFRSSDLSESQVILWARTDIFPGGASGSLPKTTP